MNVPRLLRPVRGVVREGPKCSSTRESQNGPRMEGPAEDECGAPVPVGMANLRQRAFRAGRYLFTADNAYPGEGEVFHRVRSSSGAVPDVVRRVEAVVSYRSLMAVPTPATHRSGAGSNPESQR